MNNRKVIYGALVLIGIGIGVAAALRYARYNDVDLPLWVYLLAIPLVVGLIALDVRSRRTTSAHQTSGGESPHSSGTSA